MGGRAERSGGGTSGRGGGVVIGLADALGAKGMSLGAKAASIVPELLRHTVTPVERLRRVFGVFPGWHCTGCGRPFEVADMSRDTDNAGRHLGGVACPGCRKPLPRRCSVKGCNGSVEPLRGHGHRNQGWYAGGGACPACVADGARVARSQVFASRIPVSTVEGALGWTLDKPWRQKVADYSEMWLSGSRHTTSIYIHGPIGTGKSVAAAHLVRLVYMAQGAAADFAWTTERKLLDAHVARYGQDAEAGARALELLGTAKVVPVLVIDEAFAGGVGFYTDRQVDLLFEILSSRLENRLVTVVVSNSPPVVDPGTGRTIWHAAFGTGGDGRRGEAIASRWAQVGDYIGAAGADRRRVYPGAVRS